METIISRSNIFEKQGITDFGLYLLKSAVSTALNKVTLATLRWVENILFSSGNLRIFLSGSHISLNNFHTILKLISSWSVLLFIFYGKKNISFSSLFEMFCAIWYHLYNLKNLKNIHGGVLLLVKLQAFRMF